jgi:hypothetical protein
MYLTIQVLDKIGGCISGKKESAKSSQQKNDGKRSQLQAFEPSGSGMIKPARGVYRPFPTLSRAMFLV